MQCYRRIFVVKLARMYTLNAINIQRVARGHIARRGEVRDILEANHAARVITRGLRTYIVNKARVTHTHYYYFSITQSRTITEALFSFASGSCARRFACSFMQLRKIAPSSGFVFVDDHKQTLPELSREHQQC